MNPSEEQQSYRTGRKEILENIGGFALILALIFGGFFFFDMEKVRSAIEVAGIWAPVLLILAKASTMVFAPVSGSPLYPLAGALFGFGPGFLYLALGDALGSVISFGISRKFGRKGVERFIKKDMAIVSKAVETIGTPKGFFIARVCLVALPEAASYAAGLTALGFVPFFFIQNIVGLAPSAVLAFGGEKLLSLTSPFAIVGLLLAGTVAAAVGLGAFAWWSKRTTAGKPPLV